MDSVLNAKRRDISEEIVHQNKRKKEPAAPFTPRNMMGKDAHTHIQVSVALMDEDEKEALFKAA